ncbi:hypothetical protein BK126_15035 [Paenibacillus sp. FSL H7-0326]|uniref:hypothetical protein n=1 Tax=Paenibacillus sp. FSL H7-0326 TaxID=1921144 RepID=UPI00096E48FD|nr:hypothetical protein [Paenibacillus sp. FSL H7-0326]OMC69088.1 hypothetical protein BK126_15035 [Paenibacillus sp. FSL H7-0326]
MSTQRVDTVEKYFKPLLTSDKLSNWLLYTSIVLSFVLLYVGESATLKSILNVFFIVVTLLYFAASNVTSLYLARRAQNKRMTHLISNSFGVSLDDEETNLYYNNTQNPSVTRLGINVFENSLFSKTTASRMVVGERIKIAVYIVLSVVLIINRNTSLELLAIIAQTLLTTTILTNLIKLEIIRHGFETIYDACRTLFLNRSVNANAELFTGQVLDIVMKYEILKASMGINLSSGIFHKINAETTIEWEKVKRKLEI